MLRLLFVAFLWCHFFGFETEIKADSGETDIASREQQIKRHDGWLHNVAEDPQSVQGFTLRPSTSHRFGSSRPTRLLHTHGGKSPHRTGQQIAQESFHLLKHAPLHTRLNCVWLRTSAASQRFYYVIALRRLLC